MGLALVNRGEDDSAKPQAEKAEEQPRGRSRRSARVLIVDDEAPVRSMISVTLEHQGFDIRQASSGSEAMELLSQEPLDLVLTDIVMQDGNGIALLERIHADQPQLPVVMVSAIHDISVAIDSMRRGAYDYLLKPFEREHLVATVQRALDHRQALQESHNYQQNLEQVVRARTEMLRQAMEDLEHSYDVTLEALGDALDLKDSETEGHSKRVTAYTIALARAMGIPPDEIKIIARGAFLHDIGKMAIPDEILRKPGKLTPEEQVDHARPLHAGLPHSAQDSVSERSGGDCLYAPGTLRRQWLSEPAARQRDSRSGREFLRSPMRWMPSRATGPTARRAVSTWRAKRFYAAPGRSLIRTLSRSFSRFPTSFGTSCAARSTTRITGSRPSTSRARRRSATRKKPQFPLLKTFRLAFAARAGVAMGCRGRRLFP